MSLQGKKRVDPRWSPAPECVTPLFPPYGDNLSLICKAMTLPLLPDQVLKPNGKLLRSRTNNFVSKDSFNVPTFFISKWSFEKTKFDGNNIFELDEDLLNIVRAMDRAVGRKTNGLFIFNSTDDYKFKPLYEIITKRYKCLDLFNIEKQDMIRGDQAFDADNHAIDFVFAFVDWPLIDLCVNLINHLNKPVFMCGEYVNSNILLK